MARFKIIVWAIIFLTKLRFPPGIPIATVLKFLYHIELFKSFNLIYGHDRINKQMCTTIY